MATATSTAVAPGPRQRLLEAGVDLAVMTRRNLLVWRRTPTFVAFTLVQPIIFVLLFRFVFGGAIQVVSAGGYVDYLMPGIIAQTAGFASAPTAVALARGLSRGAIDRFRSMPMARSAYLGGRLLADTLRMFVALLVILLVGVGVGFRFHNGLGPAVAMIGLGVLFGLAMCCVSAFIGLTLKDEESVQGFGLIWLFPLTFVSSVFVPLASMPGWLQAFARHQPVTLVVDAMRGLALGGPVTAVLWKALVWLIGIVLVFVPLAVRAYRRA